jgi:hypothetical protein
MSTKPSTLDISALHVSYDQAVGNYKEAGNHSWALSTGDKGMDHSAWRLIALIVAFTVTGCLTGAGIYEQSVLDAVWPHKPSIVRPVEGGANRKLFWVPANVAAVAALLLALWAAWPIAGARNATLVAVALFATINAVTIAYFGPAVLRVEKLSVPSDDPASLAWVRRSRWRTPLSLGVNVALGRYCDNGSNHLAQLLWSFCCYEGPTRRSTGQSSLRFAPTCPPVSWLVTPTIEQILLQLNLF